MRFAALAVAIALAAACGGDDGPGISGPAAVELGTGIDSFETLGDGDTIDIVQGPQGGYHFFGSVRVGGITPGDPDDLSDPDNPTTEFRVFENGTRVDIEASRYVQGLEPIGGGEHEMTGRLVILDITDDSALDGAQVRFEVEVTGTLGNTATDARTLTAVPHPANL